MRRFAFIFAVMLASSGLFASARVDVDPRQGFPLLPGTQWIYRGFVRSQEDGSTIGKVTPVNWTMSVVRTVEREGISAVVVRGFPADLDWTEGDATPQLSVLVGARDGKFYWYSQFDAPPVLERIEDSNYSLQGLATAEKWVLQLPLAPGRKFCDEQSMRREDGEYCWVTGAPHPAALTGVKGIATGARAAYEVDYTTNPDDTEIEFVEGVGITRYEYHHHGTTADTELRLVEFHPAETAAAR